MVTDEMIEDAGLENFELEAVQVYFDVMGHLDGFEDNYLGCYPGNNSDDAVGDWLYEIEAVDLSPLDESFRSYFDWESMGRDMGFSGEVWTEYAGEGTYYIFSNEKLTQESFR